MVIKKLGFSFVFNLLLLALTNAAQVTSNSDDGAGSLRQVMADAEGGDTITFSNSFTITLASPITINKDIVIDGGNVVKISGGGATSILKINSGNVVIKNIILKDGLAKGGNGGVGRHEGKHGGGGGGAGMGGAIYAVDGVVAIENVFFLDNKAVGGNGGATTNTGFLTDYAGRGGNSSLGSGGGRGGDFDAVRNYRSELPGRRGGFGGGGGGGAKYLHGWVGGMGAKGGFGGGAGGSANSAYSNLSQLTGRYQIARGGQFGGDGGRETGAKDSAGSGGGGAGLGGAIFIQGATATIKDCSFIGNAVQSGVAGAVYKGMAGKAGQAVGGAIFVYQDAVFNSYGGVTYIGNSAQTSDDNYYIMEGAEYDTAPPVVAGTFNGEVTEKNEGEESKVSGTITVSDADADDDPQFEDIEIEDNYGSFSLVNGNWNYTLDQSKVQDLSQGDFISNKIKLTATDGTEQLITIKINGSNDAPIGIAASVAVIEDGDVITGQLSSTDSDQLVIFEENFDSLSLKPFESSSEKGGDGTDWTNELLSGWQMIKADDHGTKNGGTSVKEFDGWTFVDPVWWNQSTGGQNRSLFAKASGVIAVADPDEFDDLSDSKFNAALITPSIDVSKVEANSLILKFDSSWRKTGGVGSLIVQYDDGEEKTLLTKNSNSPDAYSETIELPLENPKGSETLTIKWDRQGDNHYWWAIDNILVLSETKRDYSVTKGVAGLEIDQDGSFTFDPSNSSYQSLAEGEVEELVAEWAVTDKGGASAQSTLTITVTGKNDSPVSVAASGETVEDGEIINGQLVVNDPDNNSTFTYALTDKVPGLVINEDGSYSFDPSVNAYQAIKSGEVKELIVNWKATDNNGAETSGKLTLKITGTNLVATPATGNAIEDGVSTSGQLIATDDNEADLKFSLVSDIAGLTINTDGSWTFEATDEVYQSIALGKTRDVVANWKVEDESLGDSVTSTLTIAVTGANDNPVAVAATNEALAGSAPPSDGSTSFDLLWVSEEDKSQTISMTLKFAKDTLGNPPETGFGDSVEGSVLTINYEGETTVHNEPRIIFSAESTLDYSKELIGQSGFGPDEGGDFNLFGVEVADGNFDGFDRFTVRAPNGSRYTLVSMKQIQSIGVSGQLVANDPDNGAQLKYSLDEPVSGLTISEDGSYFFDGSNEAYKYLPKNTSIDVTANWTVIDEYEASASGTLKISVTGSSDYTITPITANEDDEIISGQVEDPDSGSNYVLVEELAGLTLNSDGSYTFDPSDTSYQSLVEGGQKNFFVVWKADGKGDDDINGVFFLVLTGAQDVAVMTQGTVAGLTEGDEVKAVNGKLEITDADTGQSQVITQTNTEGDYGSFSITSDGSWVYTTNSALNYLNEGQEVTESFEVSSIDASSKSTIRVVITGSNDPGQVSDASADLTESDEVLNASGTLDISDLDQGQALVVEQSDVQGDYGIFNISADGAWSYVSNDALNALIGGQEVSESFEVKSVDGTATALVTLKITGTNDAAVVDSASVALNESDEDLSLSGKIGFSDADEGQTGIKEQDNVAGNYGVFTISSDGNWSYTGNEDAISRIGKDQIVEDLFNVVSSDGSTTSPIKVEITGENDAPVSQSASLEVTEGTVDSGEKLVFTFWGEGGQMETTLTLPPGFEWRDDRFVDLMIPINSENFKFNSERFSPELTEYVQNEIRFQGDLTIRGRAGEEFGEWEPWELDDLEIEIFAFGDIIIEKFPWGRRELEIRFRHKQILWEDSGFTDGLYEIERIRIEDSATSVTTGQLAASDVDSNSSLTYTLDEAIAGLSLNANGSYSFDAANPAYEYLWNGESKVVIAKWTVTDQHGAADSSELRITVNGVGEKPVDSNSPVIALLGDSEIIIEASKDGEYVDLGATCEDDIDGNISEKVEVSGQVVNLKIPGTYVIKYNCKDSSGNNAIEIIRTIIVKDTLPPVITLNGSAEVVVEAGTEYNDVGVSASDSFDDELSVEVVNGVNTNELGQYTVTYKVKDSSGNESTLQRTIIVKDTLPPVITLNGSAEVVVEAGTEYNDVGVSASDSFDDAPSVEVVNGVNTNELGQYTVTYKVKDSSGNESTLQRTVTVRDTVAPVITLNGSAEVVVEAGTEYNDAGVSASDSFDDAPSVEVVNGVNTNELGQYTVTYKVKDSSGNESTLQRTVTVRDTVAPVITLIGDNILEISSGEEYIELGASAVDNFDASVDVIISGAVDTNTPGDYEINYIAADTSENSSSITRIVKVLAPVIEPELQIFNLGGTEVSEGNVFYALFKAIDIPVGTKVYYKLSGNGLTGDDVEGGVTGSADIVPMRPGPPNTSGTIPRGGLGAIIRIPLVEDQLTEGDESIEISFFTDETFETAYDHNVYGKNIADTSTTPVDVEQKIIKLIPNRNGGTINSLTLGFNSKAGSEYEILYSNDLSNWEVLNTVESTGQTTEVSIEVQTDDFKSLFYKVRELLE